MSNVEAITQVVTTIDGIAAGNMERAETISEINETLLEVVDLIDNITREASIGAGYSVTSLNAVNEGQKTINEQKMKMEQIIQFLPGNV